MPKLAYILVLDSQPYAKTFGADINAYNKSGHQVQQMDNRDAMDFGLIHYNCHRI